MSYPPPPGQQDPNNPYAAPQGGQPGYGYPQQGGQPAYGYPQQQPGYPAYPGGGMPQQIASMPGVTITARVLLFVAGTIWSLIGLLLLIGSFAAKDVINDIPGVNNAGNAAIAIGLIGFLICGGLGALHIIPASMFGKGRSGTRVTAIIAASVNSVFGLLALLGSLGQNSGSNPLMGILWLGTAVLTIVFCALAASGQWFNRPQY